MSSAYEKLLVAIPTRNRATLAVGAIRSVLAQHIDNLHVLVSDNSTIPEETNKLSRLCRELRDERIHYMTPPAPLPMGQHWDWVMHRSLEFDASHFTMLTDRLLYRPGDLGVIIDIVRQHPDKIVSYKADLVVDHKTPATLLIHPWTGKLFEIESSRLLLLSSQTKIHESLPKIHDCIIPRRVIDTIKGRFGTVCNSAVPDLNFCYKALALEDSILFYDKSVLINHARYRSTSQSQARGIITADLADFLADLRGFGCNLATPISEPRLFLNAILHEYCVVREEAMNSKFPEIDMVQYLGSIASQLDQFEDKEFKNEVQRKLSEHGWRPSPKRKRAIFKKLATPVAWKRGFELMLTGRRTKFLWLLFSRVLRIPPPSINRFEFDTPEEALDYAIRYPPGRSTSLPAQDSLLECVTIADHDACEVGHFKHDGH